MRYSRTSYEKAGWSAKIRVEPTEAGETILKKIMCGAITPDTVPTR